MITSIATFIILAISITINLLCFAYWAENKLNNKKSIDNDTLLLPIIQPKKENLMNRINTTNQLFKTIDSVINTEIQFILKNHLILTERYDVLKTDTDIKLISSRVFESLHIDVFKEYEDEYMITSDYIMIYITRRTTTLFIGIIASL